MATQDAKRLLVVSHSTILGGAETGLLNLVGHLTHIGHSVSVLFPDAAGPLVDKVKQLGCRCLAAPLPWMLPNPANACLELARTDFAALARSVGEQPIDAVISNTLVVFHGALLAARLDIPHIWYAHELVGDSPELRPRGLLPGVYWRWLHQVSDHVLCCSEAVMEAFRHDVPEAVNCSVLPPFLEPPESEAPGAQRDASAAINLYVIGYLHERKNPEFAVEVLKALVFRGHDVGLHFIGAGELEQRVRKLAERREVAGRVVFHGRLSDPYSVFAGRCINLICALCEPFGLTIPEALARGIPVVSTRSGGPDRLLDDDWLFPTGDIRRCVAIVEAIAAAYPRGRAKACDNYRRLRPRFSAHSQQAIVEAGIAQAAASYRRKDMPQALGHEFVDAVGLAALPKETILRNIALECAVDDAVLAKDIAEEQAAPGTATIRECGTFDVLPFHNTPELDALYRAGKGVAIDLAATLDEPGQTAMGAFILLRLLCEREEKGENSTVLMLGDGIGRDSLRLAMAGFSVVYCDYGDTLTSRIAARNFAAFRLAEPDAGPIRMADRETLAEVFDAVVVLEVIEHVPEPAAFLRDVAALTKEDGIVFMSECFEGVQDQWPTHLASNENFAGALPLMAAYAGLALEDFALEPFGKPYVFRKAASGGGSQPAAALLDRRLMRELAERQLRIL